MKRIVQSVTVVTEIKKVYFPTLTIKNIKRSIQTQNNQFNTFLTLTVATMVQNGVLDHFQLSESTLK